MNFNYRLQLKTISKIKKTSKIILYSHFPILKSLEFNTVSDNPRDNLDLSHHSILLLL